MKKIFLLFTLALFTLACTKKTEKPENVLPEVTMVRMMADMALAEAKVEKLKLPSDTSRAIYQEYEKSIFQRWEVSPEEYKDSYQYYLMNYDEMNAIQAALIDTLEKRHQQAISEE